MIKSPRASVRLDQALHLGVQKCEALTERRKLCFDLRDKASKAVDAPFDIFVNSADRAQHWLRASRVQDVFDEFFQAPNDGSYTSAETERCGSRRLAQIDQRSFVHFDELYFVTEIVVFQTFLSREWFFDLPHVSGSQTKYIDIVSKFADIRFNAELGGKSAIFVHLAQLILGAGKGQPSPEERPGQTDKSACEVFLRGHGATDPLRPLSRLESREASGWRRRETVCECKQPYRKHYQGKGDCEAAQPSRMRHGAILFQDRSLVEGAAA